MEHRELMRQAIEHEGEGHRAALRGDGAAAREAYARAAKSYRTSWEAAPPEAYGRLVGLLKAAVLAGAGPGEAAYARAALGDEAADSPTAAYALAIAALVAGDDGEAARWADAMRPGPEAFGRTAAAIEALARGDGAAYGEAVTAIVRDFEAREAHLTGVAFADTAAMLEALAAARGLAVRPASAVLAPPA
ncbi:MAG TPA: hypothetical protein VGJ32_10100 [Solirubrobacteraceae bacterium]